MKPYSESNHNSLLKRLNELFEDNPGEKTITIKDRCSDCGCETVIEITPTSAGFGFQGGVLLKWSYDWYLAKCPPCYEKHFKIDDNQKTGK